MADWRWLVLAVGAGLVVMFLIAFTLPGLVGEGVAALALSGAHCRRDRRRLAADPWPSLPV